MQCNDDQAKYQCQLLPSETMEGLKISGAIAVVNKKKSILKEES